MNTIVSTWLSARRDIVLLAGDPPASIYELLRWGSTAHLAVRMGPLYVGFSITANADRIGRDFTFADDQPLPTDADVAALGWVTTLRSLAGLFGCVRRIPLGELGAAEVVTRQGAVGVGSGQIPFHAEATLGAWSGAGVDLREDRAAAMAVQALQQQARERAGLA